MVHYNNQNSLHQIFTLKGTVIRDIFPQILLYICISTIVTVINYYYVEIKINQTPWVIVGGALGLLLVFRTNTAYIGIGKVESYLARLVLVLEIWQLVFYVIGSLRGKRRIRKN